MVNVKKIKHEVYPIHSVPYLFNSNINETPHKNKLICFHEQLCTLPFMTKKHLLYLFEDKFNIEPIISEQNDCYDKLNNFTAIVPVESIQEFVKTGTDEYTANNFSKSLPIEYKIEILQKYILSLKSKRQFKHAYPSSF